MGAMIPRSLRCNVGEPSCYFGTGPNKLTNRERAMNDWLRWPSRRRFGAARHLTIEVTSHLTLDGRSHLTLDSYNDLLSYWTSYR